MQSMSMFIFCRSLVRRSRLDGPSEPAHDDDDVDDDEEEDGDYVPDDVTDAYFQSLAHEETETSTRPKATVCLIIVAALTV